MKFSSVSGAFLLGLALAGTGCAPSTTSTPTPSTSTPTPRPTVNHPAAGLATRFYHATWNDGTTDRCIYELAYPALEPAYAQDEEDYARWDAANRVIQDIAFPGIVATTTANEYDFQASAQRYISECRSDLESLLNESGDEEMPGYMNYAQSLGYTTQLFQDGLLSLVIQGYSYTGGAHGLPWMTGVTLTLPQGERLTLGDLVKEESLKPFMQHVRRELIREWDDALFEEAKMELEAFVNDTSPITDDQRAALADLEQFYLTRDGFVFYWNVYEVTPYAAGQQTVFVPFAEVRDQLITNSAIAPLLP